MATSKGRARATTAVRRGRRRTKKSGPVLSEETVGTNLSDADHVTFMSYVTGGEGRKADVLRNLVHEAIQARELKRGGSRVAEKQIRRIHAEAVETGTQGIAEMLGEVLTIVRRLGVNLDKVLAGSEVNFGLLFELLKLSEGTSAMVMKDLTRPILEAKAKRAGEVEATVEEMRGRFERRAVDKVDKVRAEVQANTRRAA